MSWSSGGSSGFSFGQSNSNKPTNNIFGQTSSPSFSNNTDQNFGTQNSGFRSSNANSPFGSQPSTAGFGANSFGQNSSAGFGTSSPSTDNIFRSNSAITQNGTTSFGSFGNQNANNTFGQNNTGNSLFSQSKPASSFGSFSSNNLFGNNTNSSSTNFSLTNSNTLGSSSLFGQNSNQQAGSGTAQPPYQVTTERDVQKGGNNIFQSITCMPAYQNFSFEELRSQDYNLGRRYGSSSGTGIFGQSTGFGGFAQSNQNQSQPQGSLFGQQNQGNKAQSTGLFGTPNTSAFNFPGSVNNNQNNLFGNANDSNTSNSTFGKIGSASGSLFGTSSQQQPFGQQASGNSNTGISGGNSLFNQSKSPFSFASNNASSALPQKNENANSLFGNTGSQNNFGTNNQPLFGSNASQQAQGSVFNSNLSQAQPSIFGSTPDQSNQNNQGSTPLLGSSAISTQPQGASFNLSFGSSSLPSSAPINSANSNRPLTFGSGGLHSNTSNNSSTNLFNPSNNSGFGNNQGLSVTPTSGGNNTINNGTSQLNNAGSPSINLFPNGNKIFGNGMGNSASGFHQGQSNGVPSQSGQLNNANIISANGAQNLMYNPQSLQTSIDQSPFSTNPLFQTSQSIPNSSPGPIATPLASSQKKKQGQVPFFKITPRSTSLRGNPSSNRYANSSPSGWKVNSPMINRQLNFLNSFGKESLLSPEAFAPKINLKRLIVNKEGTLKEAQKMGDEKVSYFNDKFDTSSQKIISSKSELHDISNSNFIDNDPNRKVQNSEITHPIIAASKNKQSTFDEYWSSPSLMKLQDLTKDQLRKVENFHIGRKGYGQISFNQPVDLSEIDRIESIIGEIVIFDKKVCYVYPDDKSKPLKGKGLNVPATITLEKCWPLSKETREPIKDIDHPRYQMHIQKLKRIPDTEFIDFTRDDGAWIFRVKHFSKYGLEDQDDADDDCLEASNLERRDWTNKSDNDTGKFSTKNEMKNDYTSQEKKEFSINADKINLSESLLRQSPNKTSYTGTSHVEAPGAFPMEETADEVQKQRVNRRKSFDADFDGAAYKRKEGSAANKFPDNRSNIYSMDFDDIEYKKDIIELEKDVHLTTDVDPSFPSTSRSIEAEDKSMLKSGTLMNGNESEIEHAYKLNKSAETWESQLKLEMDRLFLLMSNNPTRADLQKKLKFELYDSNEWKEEEALKARKHFSFNPAMPIRLDSGIFFSTQGNRIIFNVVGDQEIAIEILENVVRQSLEQSEIYVDQNDLPFALLRRDSSSVTFSKTSNDLYSRNLWNFIKILFDRIFLQIDENDLKDQQISEIIENVRFEMLSNWLVEISRKDCKERTSNVFKRIYHLLIEGRFDEAIEEAQISSNPNLSMLLSVRGSDKSILEDLSSQLSQWQNRGDLKFMDEYLIRIYQLLSANFHPNGEPFFELFDHENWMQNLALQLWFGDMEFKSSLLDTLKERSKLSDLAGINPKCYDDIYYYLLIIYLDPTFPLDRLTMMNYYKSPASILQAWQVVSYLRSKVDNDFSDRRVLSSGNAIKNASVLMDRLTMSLVDRLEDLSLWEASIFLALHIEMPLTRERRIRYLLTRYLEDKSDISDSDLSKRFLIPLNWIQEARAVSSFHREDYSHYTEQLLLLGRRELAHEVFTSLVAPQLVIENEIEKLRIILGGQIYEDYVNIVSREHPPLIIKGAISSSDKLGVIVRLLKGVSNVKCHTDSQIISLQLMKKNICGFLLKMPESQPQLDLLAYEDDAATSLALSSATHFGEILI